MAEPILSPLPTSNRERAFSDCIDNDPTVRRAMMILAGPPTEKDFQDMVIALVGEKKSLVKRLMELELIAPRRIKVGNQTFIYRCPDELIS
jgi:hypothetical protein